MFRWRRAVPALFAPFGAKSALPVFSEGLNRENRLSVVALTGEVGWHGRIGTRCVSVAIAVGDVFGQREGEPDDEEEERPDGEIFP